MKVLSWWQIWAWHDFCHDCSPSAEFHKQLLSLPSGYLHHYVETPLQKLKAQTRHKALLRFVYLKQMNTWEPPGGLSSWLQYYVLSFEHSLSLWPAEEAQGAAPLCRPTHFFLLLHFLPLCFLVIVFHEKQSSKSSPTQADCPLFFFFSSIHFFQRNLNTKTTIKVLFF